MTRIHGARALQSAMMILVAGCRADVDRSASASDGISIGSIASSIGDDADGDDTSDTSEGSSGAPIVEDTGAASGADEGGTAPASDEGGPTDGGVPMDTGSGDPVIDACLDIAANACEMCGCNLCLTPLYACQQDVGCVAMRECALQTGCVGADCLDPCGAVIDMHGGPFGSSGALALELSDCLSASCPVCF
jgi:hypothetical protein